MTPSCPRYFERGIGRQLQLIGVPPTEGVSGQTVDCKNDWYVKFQTCVSPRTPGFVLTDIFGRKKRQQEILYDFQHEAAQRTVPTKAGSFSHDVTCYYAPSFDKRTTWSALPACINSLRAPPLPLVYLPRSSLPVECAHIWNFFGPVAFYLLYKAHPEVSTCQRNCVRVVHR